jgi:hypothetical protein
MFDIGSNLIRKDMKKWLFMFSMASASAQAPVYLNLGSHNEINDPLHYNTVYIDYESTKTRLLEIADTVAHYGARWNMQVESNFIRGCVAFDTARTNPNNFLNWADAQTYIEVDPHNHFILPFVNPYNPTDLNCLLVDSCLLGTPRKNLGGFIWRDFTSPPCTTDMAENWSHYNTGSENGNKFPGQTWRPTVLWGGGSPSHCEDANTLGIWKPQDATSANFYTHTPGNYEVVIGSNCGDNYVIFDTSDVNHVIQHVADVVNYAQVYGNDSSDFYTITVMFNFRDLTSAGMIDKISAFIRGMETYQNQGKVIWATLTEKYDTWYATHTNDEKFIKQCTDMNLGDELIDISPMVTVFPNPADDRIQIRFPYEYQEAGYEIISLSGQVMATGGVSGNVIVTSGLGGGLYFLRLTVDGNVAIKKILVQH